METLFRKCSFSVAISPVKTLRPTWRWMPTEVCLLVSPCACVPYRSAIHDPHRRQLYRAGGPHRLVPSHQPLQPLPVHPRAQRPMVIRSPPSSANPFHVHSTPLEQDRPCCVRLEPVPDKVYGAGNCGVSRGLDGEDDAKFSGCQA